MKNKAERVIKRTQIKNNALKEEWNMQNKERNKERKIKKEIKKER